MEKEMQDVTAVESAAPETSPANEGNAHLTQEQVNRIVADRAKRAADSAVRSLLESLGLSSPDELRGMVEEARKAKEAEMSEVQKLQARLESEAKRAAAAEEALKAERRARLEEKRDGLLRTLANEAHDPNEVVLLLKAGNAAAIEALMDDSGVVDQKQAQTLIDRLKKDKPHLFKHLSAPGSPSNYDGKPRAKQGMQLTRSFKL